MNEGRCVGGRVRMYAFYGMCLYACIQLYIILWRENLDWFTGQIERTITDISRLRRRDKYYFWHLYHS